MPGDHFITEPIASITHGVTIRRSAAEVWPWLVQMGAGRGGWYSYDFLDNRGYTSAETILDEFQDIAVGHVLPALPGATDAFIVIDLDTGRSLVLGWSEEPDTDPITTWAFALEESGSSRARLIERSRIQSPYRPYGLPEWIAVPIARLAHAVMVRKHLRGIARRVEFAATGS